MHCSTVIVVGDENIGKTCLIVTHIANAFPKEQ